MKRTVWMFRLDGHWFHTTPREAAWLLMVFSCPIKLADYDGPLAHWEVAPNPMNQLTASDARERMRGIDGQLDLLGGWIDAARAAGDHDRAEELLNRHDDLMRERRKLSAVYESEADARFGHFADMFGVKTHFMPTSPAVLLADLAKLVREARQIGEATKENTQ